MLLFIQAIAALAAVSSKLSFAKNFVSDYQFETSDNSAILFDISTDPYESNDVSGSSEYASYLDTFAERRSYWQGLAMDVSEPDDTNKKVAWTSCGRVCPWLEDTTTEKTIEQKYSYSEAPHIVYILVDDWGYNDLGKVSTYLSWTTPNLDRLANNGILLDNYYTNEVCAPSRSSLMTGRYTLRLGVYTNAAELPLTETTLAEELKSAGYRNYAIGKWHLGFSSKAYMPLQRGFDYFYGYVNGKSDYYTKIASDEYVDLFENNDFVTDSEALDTSYHSAYLYQTKAEEAIKYHAENHAETPMFLYYAMQLVHEPWTAPAEYLSRCVSTEDDTDAIPNYCAMNVMMDEAVGNLTCTLEKYGFSDNTVLIISGDNGGESTIDGSSYPFKGMKGSVMRGGVSNHAIIHSSLIPESRRGSTYSNNVHITDWLPTLMNLATSSEWTGSYSGAEIDGVNVWDSIIADSPTSRTEMVFSAYEDSIAMQIDNLKYIYNFGKAQEQVPSTVFSSDLHPEESRMVCDEPSLVQFSSRKPFLSALPLSMSNVGANIGSAILFASVLIVAISAFALIGHFKSIKSESASDADLYNTYKGRVEDVEAETRALL